MIRTGCYIAILLATVAWDFAVATVAGQAAPPTFEVSSVRENTSASGGTQIDRPPRRLILTNMRLREIIELAYGLQTFQLIADGHAWIDAARYDINALADREIPVTLPGGQPGPDVLMLQTLLADRFKLVAHRETRDQPIYALTIGRSDGTLGPQLTRSGSDCEAIVDAMARGAAPPQPGAGGRLRCRLQGTARGWAMSGFPLSQLATALSAEVGRFVVDRTGLQGTVELQLTYQREQSGSPRPASADPDLPDLFTAVQEQLGLRLQPARGPVEVLVIDSIDRPSPD